MALVGKAYVEIHAITDAVNKEIRDGLDKGMQGEGTKVGDTFSKEFDKSLHDNSKVSIKKLSDDFDKELGKAGDTSGKSFSDKFSAAFSKTVGSLGAKLRDAVTVDADTSKLDAKLADAKKKLDDLNRQRANPQIDLDIRALEINQKVAMDKLHELARQKPSPEVNMQIDKALLNIDQLARKVDDLKAKRATIDFDADVAKAEAEIAGLEAEIDRVDGRKIRVDTSGMTKSFAESLVGANMLFKAISTFALPLAIIAATPYIASIGYAAVQASAGVFLLPAAIGAAGLAMITFKVATAGVGKALGDAFDPAKAKAFQKDLAALTPPAREFVLAVQTMGPALNALKTSTADAFFANMGTQVKLLGSNFMPTLSGAMATVAGSFNSAFVSTMQWMNSAMGVTTVNTLLVSCAQVVHNLVTALGPVIQAFISIGAIAGPILAQLTDSVGSVAQRFATWTQSAQGIQTITRWIYEALNVLGNLYLLARNVGSILMSAFGAGNAAVGDFLQTLVDATGRMAAFFKTPAGSQALHDVFATIAQVVQNLWDKLVILWPAIEAAARAIGSLLQASGPLSNLLLSGLVPALTLFFNIINALAPILGPMATTYFTISIAMSAWGAAAKVAAAAQIAFTGATYGGAIAQKEFAVAAGISKVGMLAGAAASYVWAAAQWVVNAAMTTFVGLEYASGIGEIVAAIVLIIAVVAALVIGIYELVTHWTQVWNFLKETWSQLIGIVTTAWNAVIGFLTGLPATIANLASSAWEGLVSATTTAFDAVVGFIVALPGRIASIASTLWNGLVTGTVIAFDAVVGFVAALPNRIVYGLGWLIGRLLRLGIDAFTAILTGAETAWNAIYAWVTALPGRIITALAVLAGWLALTAMQAWDSFTTGLETAWNATVAFIEGIPAWFVSTLVSLGTWLGSTATAAWDAFTNAMVTAFNATAAWLAALPGRIVTFVMGIGPWLATVATDAWNGFTSGLTTAWNATIAWLASVPSMIGNFFSNAGTWLLSTGSDLISGLWNGIVAGWNAFWSWIGGLIDSFISGFKDGLGVHSPSTIFMEIGSDLINGLIMGLQAMWATLLGWLTTIVTGIVGAFSGLWNGIVTVATTVWGWIVAYFQMEMSGIVNIWNTIWTAVSTVFTTVWAVISTAITTGITFIQGLWNTVWGAIGGFFQQVWAGIQLEIQVAWMYVQMLISAGIYYVQAIWNAVWGTISAFFQQVWAGIQLQVQVAWMYVQMVIQTGIYYIQAIWGAVWGAISSFFVAIWTGIQNAAITIWNAISAFLIAGINAYNAFWGAVWNAIANFFRTVWAGIQSTAITIWNAIAAFFSGAFAAFTGMFNAVWNAISAAFSAVWNAMKAAVTGIWNAISAFFQGAFTAFQGLVSGTFNNVSRVITDIWNGIKTTTQSIWDGIVNVVKGAVNGVVDAANWMVGGVNKVLGFLSIPQIPAIPRLEHGGIVGFASGGSLADVAAAAGAYPAAAAGTRVGPGFMTNGPQVLVGEGRRNYPEFVIPTDPQHRRRALQLTSMLASTLLPAAQTDRMSPGARPTSKQPATVAPGGMPAFADGGILSGIGNMVSDVAGGVGDLGAWLTGSVESLTGMVANGINGIIPKSMFSGAGTKLAGEVVPAVFKKIQDALATLGGGGNWAPVMSAALAMTGQSLGDVGAGIRRLNQESGGNPLAVNRTDINWQHGTPSVGLMQVIGPTYASNKDPRRDVGPYMYGTSVDPLSNILASIHYTVRRYGSVTAGWNKAGGYDNGGWLHPGVHAINESGVPEAVIPDPARTLTNAITRAIGSLPERCEVALVRGAQAGYSAIAPAIQGIYSGMYSAARSPWQAATAATTLIHNVGEMLHSGSTSADRNGQISQPVAKAVSTAITKAPAPVIVAPPALTAAAATTGNIVTDFKSSMLGVFREFAPQLTLAMQAGNKDQINQLATKLMNDPQQSAQFKSAIRSVYQQFTPAITAAANSAIDTKVQTTTAASSAAIDAYFKQFAVHTTPGTAGTAGTAAITKTVVTPLAQAAQQALSGLKSGAQFFEDFSYRGMSNNSVLAQYNDTLADGFYKNGQQFDPKDPNMMAKLTSYLQNTINSGTSRVTTPGTAGTPGTPGTRTVGTVDDGVAVVESKMRATLNAMSRSFVSNFAKSAPDVYNAIQSAAPDLDDVLKTKSGALATFLGTQQKSDVDTFISSMGNGPTTLDSLLSLGSAVTSSSSTSSTNSPSLNFHDGAFSVTINGNADQVTVQQLNDTLTNWSSDLIRYVQQGG